MTFGEIRVWPSKVLHSLKPQRLYRPQMLAPDNTNRFNLLARHWSQARDTRERFAGGCSLFSSGARLEGRACPFDVPLEVLFLFFIPVCHNRCIFYRSNVTPLLIKQVYDLCESMKGIAEKQHVIDAHGPN
jgi:hypothetical protein